MQTFLPYESFARSAAALDNKRLGKQRVECLQIARALTDPTYGWQNHPAVNMWRGSEYWLRLYAEIICHYWTERGFKDTCFKKILTVIPFNSPEVLTYPKWLGNPDFHRSHQSNLIRKLPSHYRPIFGPSVPDNLPYIWPVK